MGTPGNTLNFAGLAEMIRYWAATGRAEEWCPKGRPLGIGREIPAAHASLVTPTGTRHWRGVTCHLRAGAEWARPSRPGAITTSGLLRTATRDQQGYPPLSAGLRHERSAKRWRAWRDSNLRPSAQKWANKEVMRCRLRSRVRLGHLATEGPVRFIPWSPEGSPNS